jgi:hypothetical protein
MFNYTKPKFRFIASIILLSELFAPLFASVPAFAATPPFGLAFLRTERHLAITPTGGTICATTPATTPGTETSIKVTFPTVPVGITTDYVVNATATNWTTSVTNLPAGATAWPGIGTATNVTGKIVTFPSTALTASTKYCFNFSGTNTLTNASAGNSFKSYLASYNAGNTKLMETEFGLSVVDGTTKYDQYTVTATVPPIFIFYLETNFDSFPADLDPTFVSVSGGVNFDITTNAKGGWIAWVKDSQQGLYSATANYTIPTSGTVDATPTVLVSNSEGYVLASDVVTDAAGGCTVAPDPEYDKTNGVIPANQVRAGGTLSSTFQPVASCTGIPPATSNGDKVLLTERASISGGTPAGTDYSDILTVVAAGNF